MSVSTERPSFERRGVLKRVSSSKNLRTFLAANLAFVPEISADVSMERYLSIARTLFYGAVSLYQKQDFQRAFIDFERFQTLVEDKLPEHGDFVKDLDEENRLWLDEAKTSAMLFLEEIVRQLDVLEDQRVAENLERQLQRGEVGQLHGYNSDADDANTVSRDDGSVDTELLAGIASAQKLTGNAEDDQALLAALMDATVRDNLPSASCSRTSSHSSKTSFTLGDSSLSNIPLPQAPPPLPPPIDITPRVPPAHPKISHSPKLRGREADPVTPPASLRYHYQSSPASDARARSSYNDVGHSGRSHNSGVSSSSPSHSRPASNRSSPSSSLNSSPRNSYRSNEQHKQRNSVQASADSRSRRDSGRSHLKEIALPTSGKYNAAGLAQTGLRVKHAEILPGMNAEDISILKCILPFYKQFYIPAPATRVVQINIAATPYYFYEDNFHVSYQNFLRGLPAEALATDAAFETNRCFFVHLGVALNIHPFALQCALRYMAKSEQKEEWTREMVMSVCQYSGCVDANALCFLWPEEFNRYRICVISGTSKEPILSYFKPAHPAVPEDDLTDILLRCTHDHFTLLRPYHQDMRSGNMRRRFRILSHILRDAYRSGSILVMRNEVQSSGGKSIERVLQRVNPAATASVR